MTKKRKKAENLEDEHRPSKTLKTNHNEGTLENSEQTSFPPELPDMNSTPSNQQIVDFNPESKPMVTYGTRNKIIGSHTSAEIKYSHYYRSTPIPLYPPINRNYTEEDMKHQTQESRTNVRNSDNKAIVVCKNGNQTFIIENINHLNIPLSQSINTEQFLIKNDSSKLISKEVQLKSGRSYEFFKTLVNKLLTIDIIYIQKRSNKPTNTSALETYEFDFKQCSQYDSSSPEIDKNSSIYLFRLKKDDILKFFLTDSKTFDYLCQHWLMLITGKLSFKQIYAYFLSPTIEYYEKNKVINFTVCNLTKSTIDKLDNEYIKNFIQAQSLSLEISLKSFQTLWKSFSKGNQGLTGGSGDDFKKYTIYISSKLAFLVTKSSLQSIDFENIIQAFSINNKISIEDTNAFLAISVANELFNLKNFTRKDEFINEIKEFWRNYLKKLIEDTVVHNKDELYDSLTNNHIMQQEIFKSHQFQLIESLSTDSHKLINLLNVFLKVNCWCYTAEQSIFKLHNHSDSGIKEAAIKILLNQNISCSMIETLIPSLKKDLELEKKVINYRNDYCPKPPISDGDINSTPVTSSRQIVPQNYLIESIIIGSTSGVLIALINRINLLLKSKNRMFIEEITTVIKIYLPLVISLYWQPNHDSVFTTLFVFYIFGHFDEIIEYPFCRSLLLFFSIWNQNEVSLDFLIRISEQCLMNLSFRWTENLTNYLLNIFFKPEQSVKNIPIQKSILSKQLGNSLSVNLYAPMKKCVQAVGSQLVQMLKF